MKRKHFLHFLAAGLLACAILPAHAQAPIKGDGGNVRIMIMPAGTMALPTDVIKKFELDKKYGFNLEVIPYSDAKGATAAIQSKSAEIVVYDWLASARLRAAGVDLIGVAPFLTYVNSLVVPKDSKINSLADLAGKKFGMSNKTGFDWILIQAAARKLNGMDISKDVQVHEGGVPLLRALIDKGDLDAVNMWNSLAPEMLASGKYRTLLTIRDLSDKMGLPTVPFLLFGMRADYAREKPANARAFAAAYRDAADILTKNEQVWAEYGTRVKMSPEALLIFKQQVRRDLLKTFTPEMNKGLEATLAAINEVAPQAVGLKQMPGNLLSMDYQ